jgi:hypothetical protein
MYHVQEANVSLGRGLKFNCKFEPAETVDQVKIEFWTLGSADVWIKISIYRRFNKLCISVISTVSS